jgi:hypothetical protein
MQQYRRHADRLRLKPSVKIIGEFYSTTERQQLPYV